MRSLSFIRQPRGRWLVALLAIGAISNARAQLLPFGPEAQLNVLTAGYQFEPDVDFGPDGDFVVVWQSQTSSGGDTSYSSIQGRRFAADGTPLDPAEFQVNTLTSGPQFGPAVAVRPDGSFVVAWSSYVSAGSDQHYTSVQARRFDAGGAPLDPVELQVNTETTGYQDFPDIGVDAAGGFVVAWRHWPEDTVATQRGRRFSAAGAPLDPADLDLRGSAAEWGVGRPALAVRPAGEFVAVWQDACTRTDGCYGVWGRRFDASGVPLDPGPFVANSGGYDLYVGRNDVAVSASGNFVVVWGSEYFVPDTGIRNIWARRFDWELAPLDPGRVLVNSPIDAEEVQPSVALDVESNFVVVWSASASTGGDTSSGSIQGRRFHADGTAQDSGGYQLNSYTTSLQAQPVVAVDPRGRVVAAWASGGSGGDDGDSWSVQGRRYLGLPFFSDGFETGDASRWSDAKPGAAPLR